MALYAYQRQDILSRWIEPSSVSEKTRQDRAQRMVEDAIAAHPAFVDVVYSVYAKGSYANNTNVRLDSDVDIVVQCQECHYADYQYDWMRPASGAPKYLGRWTPEKWRNEIVAALTKRFGPSGVNPAGAVAIHIREQPGSRPSADVVPSFDYRLYTGAYGRHEFGSTVFKKDGGQIINWPDQQLANGTDKNNRTGYRYKKFVRALKNAENFLAEEHIIKEKPSYLMECLVYNVSDDTLRCGDLVDGFNATLRELYNGLNGSNHTRWVEPNGLKTVFGGEQKWTREDALEVVANTWTELYE